MIYHFICYAFLAILALGAWSDRKNSPKKTARDIARARAARLRARAAMRAAQRERTHSRRAVAVPAQKGFRFLE
jgi:hypothetical protein